MPVRTSSATWTGSLAKGSGTMRLGSGAWEGSYTVPSRFEDGQGTNPEELIGAAHAGCFSMALSGALSRAGFEVESIETSADVDIQKGDDGWAISSITLHCVGKVPGIDEEAFLEHARGAKENCPVSKALAATTIELDARLV